MALPLGSRAQFESRKIITDIDLGPRDNTSTSLTMEQCHFMKTPVHLQFLSSHRSSVAFRTLYRCHMGTEVGGICCV